MEDKILIIGGYGAVGRIISKKLSALYPSSVIIAGRNIEKASRLSSQLSNGTAPRRLDICDWKEEDVPQGVRLVIMCIDVPSMDFVEYCISKGIQYMDITPTTEITQRIEKLDSLAKANQVSVVLSVGIAPGISNLLAQHAHNKRPDLQNIDIYILFGLGEKHGDAGYRWVFENMIDRYPLASREKDETISTLSLPKKTQLLDKRTFYSFNFADQHALLQTTNAQQVITRLAFDSRVSTRLLYLLHRMHLLKPLVKRIQKLMSKMEKYGQIGSDVYAIKAVAWSGDESYECSVIGNKEVDLTAYVAIEVAKIVCKQPLLPGVSHINEVIKNIPAFFADLKKYDEGVKFNL